MKSGKKLKSEKEFPVIEEPGALEEPEVPTSWKTMMGTGFTKALAREIVRNLSNLGAMTAKPFQRTPKVETPESRETIGAYPMVVDTSVLIDGRILPMVNSGFIVGTLVIPQVVLGEVQHIADSADAVRRAKGRRGLEVAGKLKGQKANPLVHIKVVNNTVPEVSEVDHKLTVLSKRWDAKLITVDFNLAQYARAQGIKVLNINDLAQALKMAIVPGEELTIKITHEGKEREQGVGYLSDGTMIVVDQARALVGTDATVVITKIHQTPAGQLFFGRLK